MATYEDRLRYAKCDSVQSIDPYAETMQDIVRCVPWLWGITEHQIQELRKGHLLHLGINEYGVFITLMNSEQGGEMTKDECIAALKCRVAELEMEIGDPRRPMFSALPKPLPVLYNSWVNDKDLPCESRLDTVLGIPIVYVERPPGTPPAGDIICGYPGPWPD